MSGPPRPKKRAAPRGAATPAAAALSLLAAHTPPAALDRFVGTFARPACELLSRCGHCAGLERQGFFAALSTDRCKARLRTNTDELMARGGFGSPTMFVGSSMFFGNDRLPLVRAALEAA